MRQDSVLVVLCGLSFSGKSTLARRLGAALPAALVSFDAINAARGLQGGQGIPLEEWGRTKALAHDRATALLRAGGSVVIDDTSSPRFLRDEWRTIADHEAVAFALVWVRIDPELQRHRVLTSREAGDRPDVVDEVLQEHVEHFEAPTVDEAPLTLHAADTSDPARVAELVAGIRSAVRVGRA